MIVYLASPRTQQQAEHVEDMPVLLSYALYEKWMDRYHPSFSRVLIDSGAFSELTGRAKIDVEEYTDWAHGWIEHADAIAGLDDIGGDWKRSMVNYEKTPFGFPTFHDSDPDDLLEDLVSLARQRGNWLGLGRVPPRAPRRDWVRRTLERIPDDIHVHAWAGRDCCHLRRIGSVDSTNWWRDAMKYRSMKELSHLTYGECLAIVVKRYKRERRFIVEHRQGELELTVSRGALRGGRP